MCNPIFRVFLALALLALAAQVRAQDTDIYIGSDVTAAINPNVMIVLDNSSNWSGTFSNSTTDCSADKTKFCNEVAALKAVIGGLDAQVNVGLALFAESGTNGAYVRFAARPMNAVNKAKLIGILEGLIRNGSGTDSSGSNQPYGAAMFEMFKYFGGYTSPAKAGTNVAGTPVQADGFGNTAYAGGNSNSSGTYRRDYRNNNRADSAGDLSANAFDSINSNTYNSPISSGCQKNFIIFVSNGNPSTGGDSAMPAINTRVGLGSGVITPPNHASTFDEWARYLKQTDVSSITGQQNVSTYTVAVYDPTNNCTVTATNTCASNSDTSMMKLMASGASVGGGTAYNAADFAKLVEALKKVFVDVQAVNSVFASASLPVSVNTQGTYLNQVFIGMFRPDPTALPRWSGNLKQFKFDKQNGDVVLADMNTNLVINPATGFITGCSKSYWTSPSAVTQGEGFWKNILSPANRGTCTDSDVDLTTDSPDGEVVEKGGAAQRLRQEPIAGENSQFTGRRIFTYHGTDATDTTLSAFDKTNALLTNASMATSDKDTLIDWVRGKDTQEENGNANTNEMRAYVHGDVVHSRPLALDYGAPGVVVFYGDNLGVFHAVTGAQTADGGKELWAFVPPECWTIPSRVYAQSPIVDFWSGTNPSNLATPPMSKNYCMDGGSGVYKDSTRTWIFPTMRRGGRSLYAFDVTNINNPATPPSLKWRLTPSSDGMSNLGYTWSTPRAARVNTMPTVPVLIVGGGYDNCEDQDAVPNTSCGATPLGSTVYVLNADTGAVLNSFTMTGMKSVAADVTLVDSDNDSYIDIAYAADTGGNLYRLDFKTGDSLPIQSNWTFTKIASLGDSQRKFLYSPEVVKVTANGSDPAYIGIAIGSGDREHPLSNSAAATTPVVNRFYFIKDTGVIPTPITDADLTDLGQQGGTLVTNAVINQYGWKVRLREKEQVVTTPVVVGGLIYFSTNRAVGFSGESCSNNLGEARGYSLDFLTGQGESSVFVGGGLPPSPVVATVDLGSEGTVLTCIGCRSETNHSAIGAMRPPINVPKVRKRVWWYESAD